MNEFVEQCRSEWRRLGVPDPVADEMAADLEADLAEAESEGASPEDVLGSGSFDPRSFATAWAAARGLVQQPAPNGHERPSRARTAAAIGAFALIAVVGGVLVILASPSTPARLALVSPIGAPLPAGAAVTFSPDGRTVAIGDDGTVVRLWDVHTGKPALPTGRMSTVDGVIRFSRDDDARIVVALQPPTNTRIAAVDADDSGVDTRAVGSVLLTLGLTGVVLLAIFWSWPGPRRRSPGART